MQYGLPRTALAGQGDPAGMARHSPRRAGGTAFGFVPAMARLYGRAGTGRGGRAISSDRSASTDRRS